MKIRLCEFKLEVAVGRNERLIVVRRLKDANGADLGMVYAEGVISAPTKAEHRAAIRAFLAAEAAIPSAVK